MESSQESKSTTVEDDADAPPKPIPRKKSSSNGAIKRKKSSTKAEDESRLNLLASDGRIPAEMVSNMASKMIDTVLHNYEPNPEAPPNDSVSTASASVSSTGKNKSKSLSKKESKRGDKEGVKRPGSIQKLTKLADCVECDWPHNYHPCLLSDSKDNTKCKDEMKRKGFKYEEPRNCCPNKDKSQSSFSNKGIGSDNSHKRQENTKPKSMKSAKVAPDPSMEQMNTQRPKAKTKKTVETPSEQTNTSRPKTSASTKSKSGKSKASTKKTAHVNFGTDNNSDVKDKLDNTTSRLLGNATLDFLNKLSTKSAHTPKAKSEKVERLAVSVPASTRPSQSRFNPKKPSPSDTHLPPVVISAHELKCKAFDLLTAQCICESATNSKSAKSTAAEKTPNEIDALIAEGKTAACDWDKNYHPCDKRYKKCDKSEKPDKQLCKLWKAGKSEADTSKSTKASCKSMVDANSSLTTTPSEKSYIDKVVRTAVKLAKKNMNGNCKKPRKRNKYGLDFGVGSMANSTVSSAFPLANTVVEDAISAAANQARSGKPKKKAKKTEKTASTTTATALSDSLSKKK